VQERTNRRQSVFGELRAEDLKVQGQPRTDREKVSHELSRLLDRDTLKHTGTTEAEDEDWQRDLMHL
jgi:hypothetical protein